MVETDLGTISGTWGPSQSGGMPDPPYSSGAAGISLPELCPLPMGYPLPEDPHLMLMTPVTPVTTRVFFQILDVIHNVPFG